MVFHNKLNYGSTVYDAPTIPQVPKCVKRKRSTRKKHEEKKLSAFDLLATVAGEMLLEMNSHSNLKGNNNRENKINNVQVKSEHIDLGSCNVSTLHHGSGYRRKVGSYTLSEPKVEKLNLKSEYTSEILDAMDLDIKPPALVGFDSSMEKPITKARSFPNFKNGFELDVDNDDDENSSGSTHSCSFGAIATKIYRENQVSDSRVRKFLPSKFCKGSPSYDMMVSKPAMERRMCYTRQRTKRSLFKRQKLYERHRYIEGNKASGQNSLLESEECFVKFSIKSIKVPEIYIDIPETATVGSLKKTVMEAVSSIIDKGFRVGMVYDGKEVCDDSHTLFQAGMFHNKKIDNLGFTLEPNSTQTPPSLTCKEDPKFITSSDSFLPCASTEAARKIPAEISTIDEVPTPNKLTERALTLTLNSHDSEHDFVHSSYVENVDNSKAMVPVPSVAAGPLSVTPLQKSKRSELVQRRIRRPFSVAEVEALVHAVEKLGTGRWRDVKIRAFDNAKHRTYVDLKDKWKTLVHTATIAPQQRRGEPVPQELLDRVLSAQNYWSQQQAKFRLSSSLPGPCFLA